MKLQLIRISSYGELLLDIESKFYFWNCASYEFMQELDRKAYSKREINKELENFYDKGGKHENR